MGTSTTLSFHMGSSFNEKHNNRTIPVPNADAKYESEYNWYHPNNMSLEQAYEMLFSESFNEYNSSIRKDRQFNSYLEKLQIAQQKEYEKVAELRHSGASASEIRKHKKAVKPAYEIIIGFGNIRDNPEFGKNGEMQETAKTILLEYINRFEQENKNVMLYNASIHTGESGNLHLHADVIFWADCSRGQKKQASLTKALSAMGYETDKEKGEDGKRVNAITKWENRQREILRNLSKEIGDITIIDGKHSKQHKSTEEYKIEQDREFIEKQAEELGKLQNDFVECVVSQQTDTRASYLEHLENISLKQDKENYQQLKKRNKAVLASAWNDYKSYTSTFFDEYRANKRLLWHELQTARKLSCDNKKRIHDLINNITEGTDLLIIKIIKLFIALFIAIGNVKYENQIEQLQEANKRLRQQAKEVMTESTAMASTLRAEDIDGIENAIENYEIHLSEARNLINNTIIQLNKERTQSYER